MLRFAASFMSVFFFKVCYIFLARGSDSPKYFINEFQSCSSGCFVRKKKKAHFLSVPFGFWIVTRSKTQETRVFLECVFRFLYCITKALSTAWPSLQGVWYGRRGTWHHSPKSSRIQGDTLCTRVPVHSHVVITISIRYTVEVSVFYT